MPLKSKIIRNKKPWFTPAVKSLIEDRNQAYGRWKRFKTTELYAIFKNARALVNKKIRMAKFMFY